MTDEEKKIMDEAQKEHGAVLVIRPDWWYYGMWYVYPGDKNECDWLAAIWKECADPKDPTHEWKGTYRFRYYASPDPFDKNDRRSVYNIGCPGDVDIEKMATTMSQVARLVAMRNQSNVDFVECKGSGDKLMAALQSGQYDWTHSKAAAGQESNNNSMWGHGN